MTVKLFDKSGTEVTYLIEGEEVELVNSLRRVAISEVPTIAIEDIDITKNSSALYDEIVAHRLGLIPLKTDLKTYNHRDKCKCKGKGCSRCEVKFKLKAKGPGTVYSKELVSSDKKIKPALQGIPIVKLLKGQEIELTATAVMGTGAEHAKWSPCFATYRLYPIVKIDNKKCDFCEECVSVCPRNVFAKKRDSVIVDPKNLTNCNLCMACVSECGKGAVTVMGDKNSILLTIDSFGQLDVKDIMRTASEILVDKIGDFSKKMK